MFMAEDLIGEFDPVSRRTRVAGHQLVVPPVPKFLNHNRSRVNFIRRLQKAPRISSSARNEVVFDELLKTYKGNPKVVSQQEGAGLEAKRRISAQTLHPPRRVAETATQTGATDLESLYYIAVLFFLRGHVAGDGLDSAASGHRGICASQDVEQERHGRRHE